MSGGLWAPERRALSSGLVLTVTLVAAEALAVVTVITACDGRKAESSDPPREVPGVWISDVDSDILFSRQAIWAGIERLADAGLNAAFRSSGIAGAPCTRGV